MPKKRTATSAEYAKNERTGLRKLTFAELASLLHGLLFAYEKVFINLYGNDARKLYPYIIEELSHILRTGDNPIIDNTKSLEENIERLIFFISNEEYINEIDFKKLGEGEYEFDIGVCSFAKSGVHDILKVKEGICPFGLVIASCLTELIPNSHLRITNSEFDDEGSKTRLKVFTGTAVQGGDALGPYSRVDDEVFSAPNFAPPLDELDMNIVRELRKDGRQANIDLAEKLNSSESTIRRRINGLLERGVIRGFTTLLGVTPGEAYMRSFIGIKVDPTHMETVIAKLSNMKETCSVYKAIGRHNVICEVLFSNREKFQEFIDELQYTQGVLELDYSIGSAAPKPCPWYGF